MFIYGKHIYLNPIKTIAAFNYQELLSCFASLQEHIDTKGTGYFVGYLSYEAGIIMQTKDKALFDDIYKNTCLIHKERLEPLAYFRLFEKREKVSKIFFKQNKQNLRVKNLNIISDIDIQKYKRDFSAIKEHIAKGDTYQVNYTQEILLATNKPHTNNLNRHNKSTIDKKILKSGLKLFKALCKKQNAPYKAFFYNEFLTILSFSPELFFSIKRNEITTKPMKGTINRGIEDSKKHKIDKKKDKELKKKLKQDNKNRSENIMIVDLLRNDLSRIYNAKNIKTKKLFTIHSYRTLHQMVSTIQAKLPKPFKLLDIFLAIFPCGSITGTPKLKTIEIIQALECRKRGIYCGAMGVVSSKKIVFSIPIRTLIRYKNEDFYRYGVGSGIVWDSDVNDEIKELKLKCKFLKI
ncbi:anthranilate synthase component I family protein [Helicobacter muridarum]|uniref:Anthranilate synthase component I family protein n=1 Tax=Helicobacter muridarum TaxID=216 RepID=A0A377PTD6_9HELI|nr:anthranilate synthase component I family protein [Helicobacter muridarum]TLD99573.1 anthranilate synthase component I family protein [Helicobacter muridarum]STQ85915.1 para-aminobenzoate synthase glutamine amidotransferase component I [Helicobacter muridarum]